MEMLRRQMAESAKRLDVSRRAVRTSETGPQSRSARPSIQELRRRIQERIRAIEPASPNRDRRARRLFLESVLAWEFGDQLLLDSQLDRLIDSIQETFETDPDMSRQFHDLLADMSQP